MDDLPFDAKKTTWKGLCKIGGVAAWILFAYSLLTMIIILVIGGPPDTVEEIYTLLQDNKFVGLLRLELLTITFMPLYYLVFSGLYAALRGTYDAYAALATALAFMGLTLFLSTPSMFSMVNLSDQYWAATTEAQKSIYLAAGEAVIASDMWHSTASFLGGVLLQGAGVFISILMLQGKVFSKLTAYVGILTFGLDLAHILVGFIAPGLSVVLMAIAGTLYLIWFPLVGRRLWQLGRGEGKEI